MIPLLQAFLASDAGLAMKGLLIVAFADFATGTFAALADGTFALDALAAFLRKHILGRVAPIALLLALGYFGGAAGQLFLAGAIAASTAYVLETIGSIKGNFFPPSATAAATVKPAAIANPVPTE
jgi:hypothetical protein